MPTTIIPLTPAGTLFEPVEKRKSASTTRRTKRSRVSSLMNLKLGFGRYVRKPLGCAY
jgi:hypothetical protein